MLKKILLDVGGNISDSFPVSQQLTCAVDHETGRLLKFRGCMQLTFVGGRVGAGHNRSMIGQEITGCFIMFASFILAKLLAKRLFPLTKLPAAFISFVALCNKKKSLWTNW